MFIAFIGLSNAGMVVHDDATLVALGDITSGSALLALIGLVITGYLYAKNIPGAILIGILVGVCTKAGMADKNGKIDRLNQAFMADSIATTLGACLGTSTTTTYVESAATAPALIIVGLLMIEPVRNIPFDDFSESIPAFVCIIMMPLTYSISNGILLGMITYVLMNIITGKFKKVTPTMLILAILFVLK